jgi:hypothetical protein
MVYTARMLTVVALTLAGVVIWKVAMAAGVGAKRLECPACDLYILGARPTEGTAVLCGHCREFGLFRGGKLVRVPDDHIASAPVFCAELPFENLRWPSTCTVCTQAATRGVSVQLRYEQDASLARDMGTRLATLGMFKAVNETTISLDVPHCEGHVDGAALTMPYERGQPNFGIAFRSYPYFKQFLALNSSTPRKPTMFAGPIEPS